MYTYHSGSKSENLPIILQHFDDILLRWLRDESETRLLAVLE